MNRIISHLFWIFISFWVFSCGCTKPVLKTENPKTSSAFDTAGNELGNYYNTFSDNVDSQKTIEAGLAILNNVLGSPDSGVPGIPAALGINLGDGSPGLGGSGFNAGGAGSSSDGVNPGSGGVNPSTGAVGDSGADARGTSPDANDLSSPSGNVADGTGSGNSGGVDGNSGGVGGTGNNNIVATSPSGAGSPARNSGTSGVAPNSTPAGSSGPNAGPNSTPAGSSGPIAGPNSTPAGSSGTSGVGPNSTPAGSSGTSGVAPNSTPAGSSGPSGVSPSRNSGASGVGPNSTPSRNPRPGAGNAPRAGRYGAGTVYKTELYEIQSTEELLAKEVLSYLKVIITGNEKEGRTALFPAGGFFGTSVQSLQRKFGYTPHSQKATEANVNNTDDNAKGYYFEIAQSYASNIYNYTYERYRANPIDFYISGKVEATVLSNTVELKGQLRIHPVFSDALNSAGNTIIVKFGDGNTGKGYEASRREDNIILDQNNIVQSGQLTIRHFKDGTAIDTGETYNLNNGGSHLKEKDKEVIRTLGLFQLND